MYSQFTANTIASNGIYVSITKHMVNDIYVEIHKDIYIYSIFPQEIFMVWLQYEEWIFMFERSNEIIVEWVEIWIAAD